MRLVKASGEEGITKDFIVKIWDPDIDVLVVFFSKIYEQRELPGELRKRTFIPLLRKPRAQECTDFNIFALLKHVTLVLQKILVNRIES